MKFADFLEANLANESEDQQRLLRWVVRRCRRSPRFAKKVEFAVVNQLDLQTLASALPGYQWPKIDWPDINWPDIEWPDIDWANVDWLQVVSVVLAVIRILLVFI